jgi:glycosyltransferase involved in cell wall biosynthesis
MATEADGKVCYILKRFPRLSETFILNEIRALERLGLELLIVSLLPREAGLQHSAVSEVQARVYYPPAEWLEMFRTALMPHIAVATTSPARYVKAAAKALWLGVRYAHPITTLKSFMRAVFVAARCRRDNIRHLHAHFANAPTKVAYFVSILCNIPFSFTTHAKDLYLSSEDAICDRVGAAKFVLTCTKYNLDYVRGLVPAEHWHKVHLVYHGADLTAFSTYLRGDRPTGLISAEAAPVILSVGRLVPKKGMRCLISACALLRDRGVAFRCEIVGTGPLRNDLQRQIDDLSLGGKVILLGAMTHDDLVDVYGQATAFALVPQIAENGDRDGIPNVLVEAMAAGLPVVSTSVSGIPELIEDGRTGLLVPPNDPHAAAAALERLLQDSVARRQVSTAAQRQLKERFECWESTKAIHALLLEASA